MILLSVGAGVALFGVLHVVMWRAAPSNSPRMLLLGGLATVGCAASAAAAVAGRGGLTIDIWIVLWIDSFFFVLYAFVYAGIARSVSVTLLGRIAEERAGSVHLSVLAGEYEQSSRFYNRLELMHRWGLVSVKGNLVSLTPHGSRVARWTERASSAIATRLEG